MTIENGEKRPGFERLTADSQMRLKVKFGLDPSVRVADFPSLYTSTHVHTDLVCMGVFHVDSPALHATAPIGVAFTLTVH